MNLSADMAIIFKELLERLTDEQFTDLYYKNGQKEPLHELNVIFDGQFKDKIKNGINKLIIKILDPILISNGCFFYGRSDIIKLIVETSSNIFETYLNGWTYPELIFHLFGDYAITETCELIEKLKIYYTGNKFDEWTKNETTDEDILNYINNKCQRNIIVYSYSFKYKVYHNDNNGKSPIILYKHMNNLYDLKFLPLRDDKNMEYYIKQNNTFLPTKKQKIKTFIKLRELLLNFNFNNAEYINILNKLTDALYKTELEWFDYAICEAIFHRFGPLYKIYVKS